MMAHMQHVEALLTTSSAGSLESDAQALLSCWQEDPRGCVAVVIRKNPLGSSAWPAVVVGEVIVGLLAGEQVQSSASSHVPYLVGSACRQNCCLHLALTPCRPCVP